MRILVTILILLACISASAQRERQIGQHGLIHYTPYAKFDSVQTTYLKIPAGAANGYVLTSNASGVATWQAASGGGGGLSGGTADYLARWTGASALSIGATRDDGTNVGIGVAPGTYKLNVNGSLAAQGAIHSIGAASAFQVYRRDNSALAFSILSSSGNLDFYDIAGSATRLYMTPGGVLKYSADMSGSYDARSVVDKTYVDNAISTAAYAGEAVVMTNTNYTVPTTSKIQNLLLYGSAGGTITLPTGSSADRIVLYIKNNGSVSFTLSQTLYETPTTTGTTIGSGRSYKIVYSNADSKWYLLALN